MNKSIRLLLMISLVLGIVLVLTISLPWLVRSAMEFTTMLIEKIPQMVR